MDDTKKTLITGLTVVVIDQTTKFLVRGLSKTIVLIPNLVRIEKATNTGTAFGLLQGNNTAFILLTIVVIGLFLKYYQKIKGKIFLALAMGGAIGNLIDRTFFGSVIDFIGINIWPNFNIADSAIIVGFIGLLLYNWKK